MTPTPSLSELTKDFSPDAAQIFSLLNLYQNHPSQSQIFIDILPILASSPALELVISNLTAHLFSTYPATRIGAIICPEAEGFLLGPLIANRLRVPCLVARKPRKLPGHVIRQGYEKWIGADEFEMQEGAFEGLDMRGKGCVVVDDCVGSGGSSGAVFRMCERLGQEVLEACCIFNTHVSRQVEIRRVNFPRPVYGMFSIGDEILEAMEKHEGLKDGKGEYIGDVNVP